MLRTMTQEEVGEAFNIHRTHVTKYLDEDNAETRTINFGHLEAYAEKIGGRALIAELNTIAANMPEDTPTADETHRGEEREGPKRGRPPKGTSRIRAVGAGTVRPVPLAPKPTTPAAQPGDAEDPDASSVPPTAKRRRTQRPQP